MVALAWPMWINGSPLLFFDSIGYLDQGQKAVQGGLSLIWRSTGGTGEGGAGAFERAAASAEGIRSLTYSTFAYLSYLTPLGAFGIILAQSALLMTVVAVLLCRVPHVRASDLLIVSVVMIAITPVAWFASYLMPDVLVAVPILCAMIIVRGIQGLSFWTLLLLCAVASFAAASHYGHLPLALGVGVVAVAILTVQRRLTLAAVVLALVPALLAGAVNIAASKIAFGEPSVAPLRLPLLLARSIVDGPARWHLETRCPEQTYAICELFEQEIPSDLEVLLWSDTGMLTRSTPEQLARIRDEEMLILRRAFLEYPLQQTWSLTANATRQLWTIGTSDFRWGRLLRGPDGQFGREGAVRRVGLDAIGAVHIGSTLAAIGLIVLWGWRDGLKVGPREREMLFVALAGLAINAAIFGGLSAPADRYQTRVIWILPLLSAVYWLARREATARGSDMSQRSAERR